MANKMICPAAAIAKAAKAGQGAQAAVVLAGSATVGNAEQIAGAVGTTVGAVRDVASKASDLARKPKP